jgi:hypothetical protein
MGSQPWAVDWSASPEIDPGSGALFAVNIAQDSQDQESSVKSRKSLNGGCR